MTQHAERKQRFTLTTSLGTVNWTNSAHQTDKHVLRWTRGENVTVALSCIPASHAEMRRPIITRHRDHYTANTPQSFPLKKILQHVLTHRLQQSHTQRIGRSKLQLHSESCGGSLFIRLKSKRAFQVDADAFPRFCGSNQLTSRRLIKSRF